MHSQPTFWNRFFARAFDYSLLYFVAVAVTLLFPYYLDDLFYVILAILTPLIWVPIAALCKRIWGSTPGKALFGAGMSRFRKIVGLGALALSLLGSFLTLPFTPYLTSIKHHEPKQGWVHFYATDRNFTIDLPTDPETLSSEIMIESLRFPLSYNEYKSHQKETIYYAVGYLDLPRKWRIAGAKRLLNGALDIALESEPGAEIVSKQLTRHQNHPALDFKLRQGDNEVTGRLVLIGRTLYKLIAVYPADSEQEVAHSEFIDSFDPSPHKTS